MKGSVSNGLTVESRQWTVLRVLVVDNDRDAIETMSIVLSLTGYAVEIAFGGREALEAAEKMRPDVILMDLKMPEMDGWEVAQRIRCMNVQPPPVLVAITGSGLEEDRKRSEEAGFDYHLLKPVHPLEIERILRTLVRFRQS